MLQAGIRSYSDGESDFENLSQITVSQNSNELEDTDEENDEDEEDSFLEDCEWYDTRWVLNDIFLWNKDLVTSIRFYKGVRKFFDEAILLYSKSDFSI